MKPFAFILLLALLTGCAAEEESPAPEAPASIALFNGTDLAGWTAFLDDSTAAMEDVFTTRPDSGILVVKGEPWGYLRTEELYDDYRLELDWRWSPETKSATNSGVFVKTTGPDKRWPSTVEVQLMHPAEGDFVLMDGLQMNTAPDRVHPEKPHVRRRAADATRPVGEWNTYAVTVKGDSVLVDLNGVRVNEGWGAPVGPGAVALQSEGGEIHFRNIRLTPLE